MQHNEHNEHNKSPPDQPNFNTYPYIDRRINNDKNFIEKYGSLVIALLAITGSAIAVYTSIITRMQIMEYKLEANIQVITEIKQDVQENKADTRELKDYIDDVDSSTSRSISELYKYHK